jgi:N-acetylmuramoyl-L-alanine amidase
VRAENQPDGAALVDGADSGPPLRGSAYEGAPLVEMSWRLSRLHCRGRMFLAAGLLLSSLSAVQTAQASVPVAKHRKQYVSQRAAAPATPYEHAVHLRAGLDATPRSKRTTRQYDEVLDAYRAVYHADRADPHADDSVEAVAELLAQEGRERDDPALLHSAIDQLEFLRRDWGASRFSVPALLTEGEIAERDLHDRPAARQNFTDFLRSYPHSPLAPQARVELRKVGGVVPATTRESAASAAEMAADQSRAVRERRNAIQDMSQVRAANVPQAGRSVSSTRDKGATLTALGNSSGNAPAARASSAAPTLDSWTPKAADGATLAKAGADTGNGTGTVTNTKEPAGNVAVLRNPNSIVSGVPVYRPTATDDAAHGTKAGHLSMVTGVRQWSTNTYTRIAIDLQDEVPYEASRVSNPDRIFFDFHGAKLAPQLAGKAVSVTDGGFLQRIRAAQFTGDVVRVVLDVTDVSDYSAFWLPNPSRLIIDIHGRPKDAPPPVFANAAPAPDVTAAPGNKQAAVVASQPAGAGVAMKEADVPAPHTPASRAAAAGMPTPRLARTAAPGTFVADTTAPGAKDNTSPQNGDSVAAIAALSQQPSRVRATQVPTTAPVASAVPETGESTAVVAASAPPVSDDGGRKKARRKRAGAGDDVQTADSSAKKPTPMQPETPGTVAQAAAPDAMGGRSMVRALGLKINRIVIDAGHGGHDSGTLGPGGIEEKDVVLDVALRLGKLLKQRLGADVIYTRDDDTFIPLETRTAIANKAQADLFLSIHANSSPDADARGVETYYLNFTTSADALEVAARENAVSDESIHQLSDLVKKITLQDKIAESREFASDVEGSLYQGLEAGNAGLKDRGVKKAPFVVLIGANMPSILAEISFLTNPQDASELRQGEYRQRIAEALYRGVAKYEHSLSNASVDERASAR